MGMTRNLAILTSALLLLASGAAQAAWDEAPTPQRSPRTPVSQQALVKPNLPPSKTLTGAAVVLDTERLRIDDTEIHLFGIVPPQLSASFGPQTRKALDNLTAAAPVTCLIRDRERDGRFLASCRNANNVDLAQELLQRGLAVTARGSLRNTDFDAPYTAAEQEAQTQKRGLWSTATPAGTDTKAPSPAIVTLAPIPATKPETKVEPAVPVAPKEDTPAAPPSAGISPVERYQVLILGAFMMLTAFVAFGTVVTRRRMDQREELRAIAAALRGELMAARAIFLGRLRDAESAQTAAWPRVRTTVFQAYVGRIGLLGADLARQVASIYGQSSDYGAYYSATHGKTETLSKRHALQTVTNHIEEVLPRLEGVEQGLPLHAATKLKSTASPRAMIAPQTPPMAALAAPLAVATESPEEFHETTPPKEEPLPLWSKIRKFATERLIPSSGKMEEPILDYANMSVEDLEKLAHDAEEEHGTLSVKAGGQDS